MNMKIVYALSVSLAISACAYIPSQSSGSSVANSAQRSLPIPNSTFIATNYKASDALITQLGGKLNNSQPMIVATIVNIDDLNSSSTFGRLASEQVSARFSQSGFTMIEMKFRDFVYMKQDQGELLLTREIKDVAQSHNAQAVIVGTYALTGESIFVNLKVIQPSTNVVLAVQDYTFPMDANLKSMTKVSGRK